MAVVQRSAGETMTGRTVGAALAWAIPRALCAVLAAVMSLSAPASAETRESRMTAAARPLPLLQDMGSPPELAFDFGPLKATLRADGLWQIAGPVEHAGPMCAEYRVGLRFGKGGPGCENVAWLGEPVFVTARRQCDGAVVGHRGGRLDPGLAAEFSGISCAEGVIRCDGHCSQSGPR